MEMKLVISITISQEEFQNQMDIHFQMELNERILTIIKEELLERLDGNLTLPQNLVYLSQIIPQRREYHQDLQIRDSGDLLIGNGNILLFMGKLNFFIK